MKHGTPTAYRHHSCRCEECRDSVRLERKAQRDRAKSVTREIPAHTEGTRFLWEYYGCRCASCVETMHEVYMKRKSITNGKDLPMHVEHGSRNGYDKFGCRCDACKRWSRNYNLTKTYGITLEKYEEILAAQSGVCAICKNAPTKNRSLAVDHDHETGAVRGLLCTSCNTGIGQFKDNTQLLLGAIDYLAVSNGR